MNKRERMLAAGVCGIVALWAGKSAFTRYRTAVDTHRKEYLDTQSRLSDAKFELEKGKSAVRQMEQMQQRSLPADREKALSLYKTWLLNKAKAAGLMVNDIKLAPRTTTSTAFEAIGYQMEASGTLTQLVAMLYEFYHSPQLHQITRLRLLRPPGAAQLQITLEVEALCLSSAVATDSLPEGDSKRLKLANVAEYQKNLGERDLATVYTPPRPPGPPPSEHHDAPAPPKFDESEFTHFTGTTPGASGLQAWINVRPTGETLHLNAGDPIKVGALEGTIESIEARSLVLKTGDKKFLIPLGASLRKGKELDASGNVKPEKSDEPAKKS
ncbi:MAG TPA: hypothetical protein VH107_11930 [Lacipirellulaceae bacterium]|jgi:hypothetical protein|nr:hypothetical protein [Lacipirellulaceae bacterium]